MLYEFFWYFYECIIKLLSRFKSILNFNRVSNYMFK